MSSPSPEHIIKKHRRSDGGHLLFRPVGLKIVAEIVSNVCKKNDLNEALDKISTIPTELSKPPYVNVLWRLNGNMRVGGAALSRDLLLYMLGEYPKSKEGKLRERYAKVLEKDKESVELPSKIF